jgi:hypothetical protein
MTVMLRAARVLWLASLSTISLNVQAGVAPNTWSPTGSLPSPRSNHTLTLLQSGEVLIAAGCDDLFCNTPSRASLTYDAASGTWTPAGNLVGNRMAHSATLLVNGQVLVAGGCNLSTGCPGISSAELYDPNTRQWTATSDLHVPRRNHTSTRLLDGRVFVTGGIGRCDGQVCNSLASSEIYSPQTGQWLPAASMPTRRVGHAAVLLRDGRVLVVGGCTETGLPCDTLGAIVYDLAQNTWTSTGEMLVKRTEANATLLSDGVVIVTGGLDDDGFDELGVERYDPALDTWSPAGSLHEGRLGSSATLLSTGQILLAGGDTSSAELYDPATEVSSPTDPMSVGRSNFAAIALRDHDVLAVGGLDLSHDVLASAELYHPGAGPLVSLSRTSVDFGLQEAGTVSAPAFVTVTNSGNTLLVIDSLTLGGAHPENFLASRLCPGGLVPPGATCRIALRFVATGLRTRNAELELTDNAPDSPQHVALTGFSFVVAPNQWAPGANISEGRSDHTSTVLPDRSVLVAGGSVTASADVYDPATATWQATAPMKAIRHGHTATLLLDGRVLVAGGGRASAELYDPATNVWRTTGSMSQSRQNAIAARLSDGRVLVSGGCDANACTSAELYDPASGSWSGAASMHFARIRHTATTLLSGRVLVAGGGTATAELYDGNSGAWIQTGSMATARAAHTATLLGNGGVLVTGGCDGDPCRSTERYNPATGQWLRTPKMLLGHIRQTAVALTDGRVLVAGGTYFCDPEFGFCFTTNEAEIYSPASNEWTRTGRLLLPREQHAASLLPDGRVLVTGGDYDEQIAPLSSTEIFTP